MEFAPFVERYADEPGIVELASNIQGFLQVCFGLDIVALFMRYPAEVEEQVTGSFAIPGLAGYSQRFLKVLLGLHIAPVLACSLQVRSRWPIWRAAANPSS